jgi:hypothetical protein
MCRCRRTYASYDARIPGDDAPALELTPSGSLPFPFTLSMPAAIFPILRLLSRPLRTRSILTAKPTLNMPALKRKVSSSTTSETSEAAAQLEASTSASASSGKTKRAKAAAPKKTKAVCSRAAC